MLACKAQPGKDFWWLTLLVGGYSKIRIQKTQIESCEIVFSQQRVALVVGIETKAQKI